MARFPKRPNTFFSVSPAGLAEHTGFAIKRGEIDGRIDVNYWMLAPSVNRRLENPRFDVRPLGGLLSLVQYGCSALAKDDQPGVPILRMNNLQNDGWDLSSLKYIELNERELATYRLFNGDILFNRTNSKELVGKCAVFRESGDWVFASYLIRVRTNPDRLLSQFAADFLGTETGRLQLNQVSRQIIGMTNINAEEIRNLRIPLPSVAEQAKLVSAMDKARTERQAKLAQAEALLAGLDNFVLDSLGIEIATKSPQKAFAVRRGDLTQLQLGPSHYVPDLQTFLRILNSHPAASQTLDAYADVNPQVDLTGWDDQEIVGFIPMGSVSDSATGEYTFERRTLEEVRKGYTPFADGDILWAKITPSMQNGKSCIVEGLPNGVGFGSTEFHVLRVRDEAVSKEFVKEFISQRTMRQVATYAFTGSAGQQRVSATFLQGLPFPAVSRHFQDQIVSEIATTREKAHSLRTDAEIDWQEAKSWFEQQLLGPVTQ